MARTDPITDDQIAWIDRLSRDTIVDYEGEHTLDDYVQPVYGCKLFAMNRGQASMLITDLKWQAEIDGAEKPEWTSIFSEDGRE